MYGQQKKISLEIGKKKERKKRREEGRDAFTLSQGNTTNRQVVEVD